MIIRYVVTVVLWMVGKTIAPHAAATGALWLVVWISTAVSARIILVAPYRFGFRNSTKGLQLTWYLFIGEIVLLAAAFVLALDDRGSVFAAWTMLAAAIGLEAFLTKLELNQHRRIGTIVPSLRSEPLDHEWQVTGESWGGVNDEFKRALAIAFPHVATVLRAYLVIATHTGERHRLLAIRFAFLWSDDDAIAIAQRVFGALFPSGERLRIIMLDDAGEARVRAVAAPFYDRAIPADEARVTRTTNEGGASRKTPLDRWS